MASPHILARLVGKHKASILNGATADTGGDVGAKGSRFLDRGEGVELGSIEPFAASGSTSNVGINPSKQLFLEEEDRLEWAESSTGTFAIASTYKEACPQETGQTWK